MIERAYLMLHTTNGKSEEIFQYLQYKPGVVLADMVDGDADFILTIEARTKEKLAEFTVSILVELEMMIQKFDLLTIHKTSNIHD